MSARWLRALCALVLVLAFVVPQQALGARSQNATTDVSALDTTPPLTGPPFTAAVWFRAPDNGVEHSLMGLSTAANLNYHLWLSASGNDGQNDLSFYAADGATFTQATAGPYNTDNVTWQHAAAVGASTTSRICYLNGVPGTESTTSRASTAATRFSVGNQVFAATNTGNGQSVAHAALWKVALTAGEVLSLARGAHPRAIRPTAPDGTPALVYYCSFLGDATNESNAVTGEVLTTTSADKASNPPLLRGGRR